MDEQRKRRKSGSEQSNLIPTRVDVNTVVKGPQDSSMRE